MRRRALDMSVAFLALLAVCVPLALATKGDVTLVSQTDAGVGGDAGGSEGAISGDGRFAVFASNSSNLSAQDVDPTRDIFLRDLQAGTTSFISRASEIDGGSASNGDSGEPSISDDGRFIAFASGGTNIGGVPDMNNASDVFIRDTQLGSTNLVSRASGLNGARGDTASTQPSLSGDGGIVAFVSGANNLSTEDDNNVSNVFIRDPQAQPPTTTLISRATGAAGAGANGDSTDVSISSDGRKIAFRSAATNLSDADNDAATDIFVRDIDENTTTLISRQSDSAGGAGGDGDSDSPSISGDGQVIAFGSAAGNFIDFNDPAALESIYVRDTATGITALASRQSRNDGARPATGSSQDPAISDDGRFVAFGSDSDNLFPGTSDDAARQIYVRDLFGETTKLVSRAGGNGAPSDGDGEGPTLSADGHFVDFTSFAENLSAADSGATPDVFVYDLGAPTEPDFTGPNLDVKAKQQQHLKKPIKLTVTADEPASFTLGGTAKPKGVKGKPKTLQLGSTSGSAGAAGAAVALKLAPSKRVAKKLKKASKAKARLELTATDDTGNVTSQPIKIKLR